MKYVVRFGGEEREILIERTKSGVRARVGDTEHVLDLSLVGDGGTFSMLVDGRSFDVAADVQREKVALLMLGGRYAAEVEDERERAAHAVAGNRQHGKRELRAAMPGIVVDVRCKPGDDVTEGQSLVVLEAMKMQNEIQAERAGVVRRVLVAPGQAVEGGDPLVEIE